MPKTFTLPNHLENQIAALTGSDSCELVYQSDLLNDLTDQFEGFSLSPNQRSVEKVLAYSRSVEVRRSINLIDDDQIVMLN